MEAAVAELVGVREAKARLSALLGRVRRGEVITISDRGRPVARLVPVPAEEASLPDRIREAEEAGWIAAAPAAEGEIPEPVDLGGGDLAQRLLREDREAR
jgi:prevent-host-death family protein